MVTQGTTPRQLTDLIGSLADFNFRKAAIRELRLSTFRDISTTIPNKIRNLIMETEAGIPCRQLKRHLHRIPAFYPDSYLCWNLSTGIMWIKAERYAGGVDMNGVLQLKQWIVDSENIVFFGGAGVSTQAEFGFQKPGRPV